MKLEILEIQAGWGDGVGLGDQLKLGKADWEGGDPLVFQREVNWKWNPAGENWVTWICYIYTNYNLQLHLQCSAVSIDETIERDCDL